MSKKQNKETSELTCQFCNKEFVNEKKFINHMCKMKARWLDKDLKSVKLGFMAYNKYFELTKKPSQSYDSFMKSRFYTAFVKCGKFIKDCNIPDAENYITWLVKNKIRIDDWCTDETYTKYILYVIKSEPAIRAYERFVMFAEQWGIRTNSNWLNFFDEVSTFEAINYIQNGRISPWILFTSKKAGDFLERLNEEQVEILYKVIDQKFWSKKLSREKEAVDELVEICKQIGL